MPWISHGLIMAATKTQKEDATTVATEPTCMRVDPGPNSQTFARKQQIASHENFAMRKKCWKLATTSPRFQIKISGSSIGAINKYTGPRTNRNEKCNINTHMHAIILQYLSGVSSLFYCNLQGRVFRVSRFAIKPEYKKKTCREQIYARYCQLAIFPKRSWCPLLMNAVIPSNCLKWNFSQVFMSTRIKCMRFAFSPYNALSNTFLAHGQSVIFLTAAYKMLYALCFLRSCTSHSHRPLEYNVCIRKCNFHTPAVSATPSP